MRAAAAPGPWFRSRRRCLKAQSAAVTIGSNRPGSKANPAGVTSGLPDRDERRHDPGRIFVAMRLGTDHGADDGGHLVDAVGPLERARAVIVVFPILGIGVGTAA